METLKIIGTSIVFLAFLIIIRSLKGELALPVSICISVALMGCALSIAAPVIALLKQYSAVVGGDFMEILLKSLGISLLTSIGSDICRDFGENAIAAKVELVGKCSLLSLCIPIIQELVSMISGVILQ